MAEIGPPLGLTVFLFIFTHKIGAYSPYVDRKNYVSQKTSYDEPDVKAGGVWRGAPKGKPAIVKLHAIYEKKRNREARGWNGTK
ncbi:MAG: hypothetical protein P4L43_00490 [Syntrophobacteraceae bacterium]|nr:hypothetical protein [Syntrophobacteraceae bacterium]